MPGLVVGMGGGSGAGKSTIASELVDRLRADGVLAAAVGLDAFFHRDGPGLAGAPVIELAGERVPDRNCPGAVDVSRAVAEVRRLAGEFRVVVLEGHLALHYSELRALMTLKVFVDLPADVRVVRRMLRDLAGGRGSRDPRWIAEYYLRCARPGHERWVEPSRRWADVILAGDADPATNAEALLRRLGQHGHL